MNFSPAAFAAGAAFIGGAGIAARLAVVGAAGIVAGVAVGRKPIPRLGPIGIDGGGYARRDGAASGEILLADSSGILRGQSPAKRLMPKYLISHIYAAVDAFPTSRRKSTPARQALSCVFLLGCLPA